MKMKTKVSGGFTLLELITVIAIIGVAASLANPSYDRLIRRNEVAKIARSFESALQVAKHTAKVSGRSITVCGVNNINNATPTCLASLNDFNSDQSGDFGWLVFRDTDSDNVVDTGEKVLKKVPFSKRRVKMIWNGAARIVITSRNNTGGAGTLRVYAPLVSSEKCKTVNKDYDPAKCLATCTQRNNKPPYDVTRCPLNSNKSGAVNSYLSESRVVLSRLGNITFLK